MIRKIAMAFGGFLALAAAAIGFGPTEPIDETITFQASSLGSDLDEYLVKAEANTPNLIDGAQKFQLANMRAGRNSAEGIKRTSEANRQVWKLLEESGNDLKIHPQFMQ